MYFKLIDLIIMYVVIINVFLLNDRLQGLH